MLLMFVLGFGAAMTVAAKGFDRYLLPIFPALDLLAGLGLWRFGLTSALSASNQWAPRRPSRVGKPLGAINC